MAKELEELREVRKQKLPTATTFSPRNSLSKLSSPLGLPKEFAQMEQRLQEIHPKEEDRMFYYHSSEDRIVLSHALFWVMTQPQCLKGKIRKERFFLLLRQYEEEMLDAFLTEDDYFPELLRYCNILYEMLPTILMVHRDRYCFTSACFTQASIVRARVSRSDENTKW